MCLQERVLYVGEYACEDPRVPSVAANKKNCY